MTAEAIAIGSAVVSALLSVTVGLVQMHWRATISRLDERFTYERAKLDHLIVENNQHAVLLARLEAVSSDVFRRIESIDEDLAVFRRELVNISQSLVRIETQIRKSTPPPKGG